MAVQFGQADVQQYDVGLDQCCRLYCGQSVLGGMDPVPHQLEHMGQAHHRVAIIVDHQDTVTHVRAGHFADRISGEGEPNHE